MQSGGLTRRHPVPGVRPGDFVEKSFAAARLGVILQQVSGDKALQQEEDADVDEDGSHGLALSIVEGVAGDVQQRTVRLL
eukprot:464172-Heterocapsa_arctica.AAC.1